jgi:hypothetical protein
VIDLISKYFSIFLLIFDNAATNFIAPIYSFAFAIAIVKFYLLVPIFDDLSFFFFLQKPNDFF